MTFVLLVCHHDQNRIHTLHLAGVSIEFLVALPLLFPPWRNYLLSKESEALRSGPGEVCSLFCFSLAVQRIIRSHSVENIAQADGRGRMETVGKDPWKWVTTTFSPVNQGKAVKGRGQRKAKHCRVRSESQKTKSSSSHTSGVTQRMEWILWVILGRV